MATSKKSKQKSSGHAGAVLAAVAAITAGVYFFATKQGKKQRIKLQGWVMKAEHDVMERLKDVGEVNKEAYEAIVDAVLENYRKAKKVDVEVLSDLRAELLGQWKNIEHKTRRGISKVKRLVKK